ncbi:formyl transferase [Cladorrhinum sp. PSN332]|nr:formyl transferase [Cladorrhinum sp. PSN332]
MLLLRSRPFLGASMRSSASRLFSPLYSRFSSTTPISSLGKPKSDPLRILFCGSDLFSSSSLTALWDEMQNQNLSKENRLIESIDVMVRPPKPTGRGNRSLIKAPVHVQAESLQLPVHIRDTFTGWDLPPHINLIIAVSFGLFVPKRILSQTKYGGLNVHPSLLPDLRGPAPIHHAILNNYTHTGVTIQTLSTEAFDHGTVLSQTSPNEIRIQPDDTFTTVRDYMATKGAEMLLHVLKTNRHVPPYLDVSHHFKVIHHAPKTLTKDRQVDWLVSDPPLPKLASQPASARIYNQYRSLGTLWTHSRLHGLTENTKYPLTKGGYQRLQLTGVSVPSDPNLTFEEAIGHNTKKKNEDEPFSQLASLLEEEDRWNVIDWAQQTGRGGEFRFIPARWAPNPNAEMPGQIAVEIPPNHKQTLSSDRPSLIYIDSIKVAGEAAKYAADVASKFGRRRMKLSELRKLQAVHLGIRKVWDSPGAVDK